MIVELPRRLDQSSVNQLMSLVIDENSNPKNEKLIFDFSYLEFIEPAGVTSLGNLFEWLLKRNCSAQIKYPENIGVKKWCPIKYLDDSEFFLRYTGEKIDSNSKVRPTTIPLQKVTYGKSYNWLKTDFIPWLSNRISVQEKTLASIDICLGEIFNNIRDHSFEKIGCLYAQHFPNKDKVIFSIADFGVGIPHNVRKIHAGINDAKALELAVEEGFTTKTSPRNLGAGLHTLIMNVVNKTNGYVRIHSGYGILNAYFGKDKIEINSSLSNGYYPGTFLDINIDTKTIIKEDQYDEQEEFIW